MESDAHELLEYLIKMKKEWEQHAEEVYYTNKEMYHKFMEEAKRFHMMICATKSVMEHGRRFHLVLNELKKRVQK